MHSQKTANIPLPENMHTYLNNNFLILNSTSHWGCFCIHLVVTFFYKNTILRQTCCSYLQRYKLVVRTNWYSSCNRHISWIGARIIMLRHWSSPGHWTKHVRWRRHHISYKNKKLLGLSSKQRYQFLKSPGLPQLHLSACCSSFQQSLTCFIFTSK